MNDQDIGRQVFSRVTDIRIVFAFYTCALVFHYLIIVSLAGTYTLTRCLLLFANYSRDYNIIAFEWEWIGGVLPINVTRKRKRTTRLINLRFIRCLYRVTLPLHRSCSVLGLERVMGLAITGQLFGQRWSEHALVVHEPVDAEAAEHDSKEHRQLEPDRVLQRLRTTKTILPPELVLRMEL